MKTIKLGNSKKSTIVDDEDYSRLARFAWQLGTSGYVTRSGSYLVRMMHRLIMDPTKKDLVDHINGDPLDNRKCNLRICTPSQNVMNKKISFSNKTGYKGVYFDKKRNNYQASITLNYKHIHLGRFKTKEEAGRAYNKAARESHGAYARLNEVVE